MNEIGSKLHNPPIIEAVCDIDCDMPPMFSLGEIEAAAESSLGPKYVKRRRQFRQIIQGKFSTPDNTTFQAEQVASMFLPEDEKEIVQFRTDGYSFNRLAPYGALDDYLPEIGRTWVAFCNIAKPKQVCAIRLRYINRILLPMSNNHLMLGDYLFASPILPKELNLNFTGFLDQHHAIERDTKHSVSIVLASEQIADDKLPVILDITVAANEKCEIENWTWILNKIQALRGLKNRVFCNTLTQKCLNLFQQQQ